MCGIVGYIGFQDALPVILSGLQKLEYRGYDSAGVALYCNGKMDVTRALGKLGELKRALEDKGMPQGARLGIGHTRWATHGKPSENNAHPHTAGRISLIHNGIIENYVELRERLTKEGCVFSSETDTEIAAHLLNKYLQEGKYPLEAMHLACRDIRGSYAFVAIDSEMPDRLLVAKNATPLVIGVGEGEMFVASDIPAVVGFTKKIIILEEGDFAEITADQVKVEHGDQLVERKIQTVAWDAVTAQKGGYKHFMLKEIHEQVTVIPEAFRGRVGQGDPKVFLPELSFSDDELKKIDRIILVSCGTAWHACLVAKFYIEELAGVPCEVDYASEFRYRHPLLNGRTLVMAVSQSGETADTLAAMDLAAGKAEELAICNVLGSSLSRKVDNVIYTHAGPEMSVASTKAFSTQLVALYLWAVYFGQRRGALNSKRVGTLVGDLFHLATAMDGALKTEKLIQEVARKFYHARDFLYVGRGICYPIALEGALKLKEISYVHAEGYPAGELKHGPIALIDEHMPVVVVLQRSEQVFEKALSNMKEVESRDGKIIAVTDVHNHAELKKVAQCVIEVPYISEYLSPIVLSVPLQLLAYHIAVLNGTDVDLPRNLAKSVTVE